MGPRSPAPTFLLEFFSPANVYRMVEKYLCSKPTFLVANDQSSQNACSKYPSQTKWIWQFFRETILPPLPGGCALDAIASALASIIKWQSLLWPQSYGAFILSKFNMSNRESTFQNERHSANSVNKPFLNRVPSSRSGRINSIRYFSNWLDTFQIAQFPSKSNKLNRLH